MLEYGIALAVCAVMAALARNRDMSMGLLIIIGSWAAWCAFIIATGIYEPWHFGILEASAAAYLFLRHPSSKPKAIIGALFAVQVAMHLAYGAVLLCTGEADWQTYDTQTSLTGWLQLLVWGGWTGGHLLRRIERLWRVVPLARDHARDADMGRKS